MYEIVRDKLYEAFKYPGSNQYTATCRAHPGLVCFAPTAIDAMDAIKQLVHDLELKEAAQFGFQHGYNCGYHRYDIEESLAGCLNQLETPERDG